VADGVTRVELSLDEMIQVYLDAVAEVLACLESELSVDG